MQRSECLFSYYESIPPHNSLKKRRSYILILLFLFSLFSPLYAVDEKSPLQGIVFACGYCINSAGVEVAGYWNNGTWKSLKNPFGASYYAEANEIAISSSTVYVCGWCMNQENQKINGYWTNGSWTPFSAPYKSSSGKFEIYSFAVTGSNIYAGGWGYAENGNWAGLWLNGKWKSLPIPDGFSRATIQSLFISSSTVYAAAQCSTNSGDKIEGYWENNKWVTLSPQTNSSKSSIHSISVYGSTVYAAGKCDNNSGYWINGEWNTIGIPPGMDSTWISQVAVAESNVYAIGSCRNKESTFFGYWLNSVWTPLPDSNSLFKIPKVILHDTSVYLACTYSSGSTYAGPGYWVNNTWVPLRKPFGPQRAVVNDFTLIPESNGLSPSK